MALRSPAERVGSVTGIVGAAGGLGGYFPPLVMGLSDNAATHSYSHRPGAALHHRHRRLDLYAGLEPQEG